MALQYNVSGVSGNANTLVAGSVIAGNSIFVGSNYKKLGFISALASVTAATATITFTGKWQVSNDNVVWVDAVYAGNPANVVFATGTSAAATKAVDAPESCYGWRYCRYVFVTGVVTGNAGDLYSIAYSYRRLTGAEGNA